MKKRYSAPLTADDAARLTDRDIDTSDIPELDEAFFANAKMLMPTSKKQVSIRLDTDVLDWFKSRQTSGYQGQINAVLRAYMVSQMQGELREPS